MVEVVNFLEWLTDPCALKMASSIRRRMSGGTWVAARPAFREDMRSGMSEVAGGTDGDFGQHAGA